VTQEQEERLANIRHYHETGTMTYVDVCDLLAMVDSLREELLTVRNKLSCTEDDLANYMDSEEKLEAQLEEARAELAQLKARYDAQSKVLQHHQSGHSVRCNEVAQLTKERDGLIARLRALGEQA